MKTFLKYISIYLPSIFYIGLGTHLLFITTPSDILYVFIFSIYIVSFYHSKNLIPPLKAVIVLLLIAFLSLWILGEGFAEIAMDYLYLFLLFEVIQTYVSKLKNNYA